jgi:nicotinamide mononucleotide transporter
VESIFEGLRASSLTEIAATMLGVTYSVLAVKRNRFCWVAGAASSALLAFLAAGRELPMQAVLQGYYVAMSAYGFWHWSRNFDAADLPVGFWPITHHAGAVAVLCGLAWLTAKFLAAETNAAWPMLDSFTTWFSLFATWLVARARIENWLYWIVIDALIVILFAAQGLNFIALLYAIYLVIAIFGFFVWLRKYRLQIRPA